MRAVRRGLSPGGVHSARSSAAPAANTLAMAAAKRGRSGVAISAWTGMPRNSIPIRAQICRPASRMRGTGWVPSSSAAPCSISSAQASASAMARGSISDRRGAWRVPRKSCQ
ncbi:MAG: hypothetical protein JKP98_21130 [Rhodobacteraceae bacterium]|nr:hypothetical protein [Paracoccaceae bacterium]